MKTYKVVIQARKAPTLNLKGETETYPIETHTFDIAAETVAGAIQSAGLKVSIGHNAEPLHVTKVLDKDYNNVLGQLV